MMKAQLVSKLKLLKRDLSKTLSAWGRFQKGDIKYFQEDGSHAEATRTMEGFLRVIGGVYSGLKLKLEALENLIRDLGDYHVSARTHICGGKYETDSGKLNNALSAQNSREIQQLTKQQLELVRVQTALARQNFEVSQQIELLSKENLALAHTGERAGEFLRRLSIASVVSQPIRRSCDL
jgi:hypothetical protein